MLTFATISSSQIHCFNNSAKMISPCGHSKETSPLRPCHWEKFTVSGRGCIRTLAPWWTGRALQEGGGEGEDETQLSLCPAKLRGRETHVDTSKQTSYCSSSRAETRLLLHSGRQGSAHTLKSTKNAKSRNAERTSETNKVTPPPPAVAAFS